MVAATCASESAANFSATIRVLSISACAPPRAMRKVRSHMTVWASQHIRIAWDDNANQALQGAKGFDRKRKVVQRYKGRCILPRSQPMPSAAITVVYGCV